MDRSRDLEIIRPMSRYAICGDAGRRLSLRPARRSSPARPGDALDAFLLRRWPQASAIEYGGASPAFPERRVCLSAILFIQCGVGRARRRPQHRGRPWRRGRGSYEFSWNGHVLVREPGSFFSSSDGRWRSYQWRIRRMSLHSTGSLRSSPSRTSGTLRPGTARRVAPGKCLRMAVCGFSATPSAAFTPASPYSEPGAFAARYAPLGRAD